MSHTFEPDVTPQNCPQCNTVLDDRESEGSLCPRCLMQIAVQTETTPTRGGIQPPEIDELAGLFPDHELQALIGQGGMGAVYRARHLKLNRLVAIKVMHPNLEHDPAFAERFEREAQVLAGLSHPGIVTIYDFGEAEGYFYLVMEFVDGASLRDLLGDGRLSVADAMNFLPPLCDALQFAHNNGVVHRDVKPENILIDGEGRVRLVDFGLAKCLGAETSQFGLTASGQAVGTPHYMAPEQLLGSTDVDHRADIYSLGVVLYEMLTGSLPIGRFAPPSNTGSTGERLDRIVMRSLSNEPADRYQQIRDVKLELADAPTAEEGSAEAHPTATPLASAPSGKRRLQQRRRRAKRGSEDHDANKGLDATELLYVWGAVLLVFAASFMNWGTIRGTPSFGSIGSPLNLGRMTFDVDGWNGTFTMLGISLGYWFATVLAMLFATIHTARRSGVDLPRWLPLVVAAAGCLFCVLPLLIAAGHEDYDVGIGNIFTLLLFFGLNLAAWKLHPRAKVTRRRRASAERTR